MKDLLLKRLLDDVSQLLGGSYGAHDLSVLSDVISHHTRMLLIAVCLEDLVELIATQMIHHVCCRHISTNKQ